MKTSNVKFRALIIPLIIGISFWLCTPVRPTGVSVTAWHMLSIFLATIIACITQPLPIAGVALTGFTIMILLRVTDFETAITAFSNKTVWLIAMAYMISRGFAKTGLGKRIALLFVKHFGQKTLGLSYAIEAIDLVTSPATPSNTARAGGIIYPIIKSLSEVFNSNPKDKTERKIGSYLIFSEFHANIVTSAMFMTAMAPNLIAIGLANSFGIKISWMEWFIAALLPGIICLLTVPFIIYKLYPPEIKETPNAKKWAEKQLATMGHISKRELSMLFIFIIALLLWMFSSILNLDATLVGFIAVLLLLFTSVLSVDDVLKENGSWNVIIWFSVLIFMANELNTLGFIPWLSKTISHAMSGMGWITVLIIISIIYFYSHYFFASQAAHVTAMYSALLGVAIAAGVLGKLAALMLAFVTAIYASSTQYANGPASVLFGSNYISQKHWWSLNFAMGIYYLIIWLGVGMVWTNVIGIW